MENLNLWFERCTILKLVTIRGSSQNFRQQDGMKQHWTIWTPFKVVFESPVWSGFLPIFSKTETETGL